MEPQLPQVNITPETQPAMPDEGHPEVVGNSVETMTYRPEVGRSSETISRPVDQGVASTPLVVPLSQATNDQDDKADDNSPSVADDGDVIEKEWIDRAKSLVSVTRSDPYKQQSEISKLMADYVLKRYGRKIGETSD